MAPKQPCAKYQYVVTPTGPKILPVEEQACKDEESPADYNAGGYLPVKVSDSFKQGRYRVIRKLGWGHFSTVWLVKDNHENRHSALKVVKSAGRYAETALDEIKLLTQVQSFSPTHPGRSHVVSFLDSFSHQGPEASHVCIVFEPLGENLLAMIERHKKKGVPKALVKTITHQMLLGLQYLHDECDLVHTDIKPENILISIPDVEAHIFQELVQSPTPTSRRVGVPLPTKTRSGVSIPPNHLRTRRQVQIFDSQPLSSPCRSAGFTTRTPATGMSINARLSGSASGSNSVTSSYIGAMNMSRLSAAGVFPSHYIKGTAGSLSSSAARKPHNAPQPGPSTAPNSLPANVGNTPTPAPANPSPPSTSSSTSSLSSTLVSTALGTSSIISTPPSSLSHSIGHAVANFLAMSKNDEGAFVHSKPLPISLLAHLEKSEHIPPKSRTSPVDALPKGSGPSSLKEPSLLSDSWIKVSNSVSSSLKSISSLGHVKQSSKKEHSRSNSGNKSSFWKDPGVAAPAPAVLVSAVVTADGSTDTGDMFHLNGLTQRTLNSESSSTTTKARPSPSGHGRLSNTSTTEPLGQAELKDHLIDAMQPHPTIPSLLTRTAPTRNSNSKLTKSLSPPPPALPVSPNDHDVTIYTSQLNDYSNSSRLNDETQSSLLLTSPPPPPPTPVVSPIFSSITPNPETEFDTQPPDFDGVAAIPPISIKIADLGNATPSKKHFTEDIQTRQYRAPEAILGRKDWDARADMWSVACVVFELLTAEYLFDPQGQGELFTKDDDHMAQIIELLGDFSLEVKMGGKYSRELFDHTGALRYIKTLKPWPLLRVMTEKYLYSEACAQALCDFLEPMLVIDMRKRSHARDIVDHYWLQITEDEEDVEEW